MTHTTGPWRVGGSGLCASVIGPDGRAIVSTGHSRRHFAECKANARLIAAAPDMETALEPFAERCPVQIDNTASDMAEIKITVRIGDLRRARAAILKAQGGE